MSYGHGTESNTEIQSITDRKIIAQPIRMLGHSTVTKNNINYFPLMNFSKYATHFCWEGGRVFSSREGNYIIIIKKLLFLS